MSMLNFLLLVSQDTILLIFHINFDYKIATIHFWPLIRVTKIAQNQHKDGICCSQNIFSSQDGCPFFPFNEKFIKSQKKIKDSWKLLCTNVAMKI